MENVNKNHMNNLKYWYYIEIEECPACGDQRKTKTRKYTPKPTNKDNRIAYYLFYDWCE